jgi:hypothetical protein
MHATNPALAQNINDLLTIFGGDRQRALRHAALAEWRRLPPAEIACIDQGLRQKGSSADALVRRGVKPSAAGLAELRSGCHRQFVQGVQTETAQRATDASQAGSPTPTAATTNPTEPKDAGVTPPSSAESPKHAGVTPPSSAESPKDAGVTQPPSAESPKHAGVTPPSSAESPKDAGVTQPSSAQSVGRFVEDQVQQGNVELNDSIPQSRIMGWLSKAFLVAVIAMVVLLGIVMYLFIRWRNTEPRTVAVSAAAIPEKNLEGGEDKATLDTTIGKTDEVVMPVADEMIQLPDQTGPGAAISVRQNSFHSSKVEPTSEEMLSGTASIETFEVSTSDGSAVESVAQLARLYAMGAPSEKEFQRLRELVSHSRT